MLSKMSALPTFVTDLILLAILSLYPANFTTLLSVQNIVLVSHRGTVIAYLLKCPTVGHLNLVKSCHFAKDYFKSKTTDK